MPIDIRIKTPARDSWDDAEVSIPAKYHRYNELYGYDRLMNIPMVELIDQMKAHHVQGSVLQAEHEWGEDEEWNTRTSELVRKFPEAFACGFGSVDPRRGSEAVREIDRCYHDLGLRGIVFEPGFLRIEPTDKRCYPIYSKCSELGIPVGLHTGINFSSDGPIRFGSPLAADEIACDFPDLTLICHHGGWPWQNESIAIAWKHPNVYLEFGAIAPRYIASGGGWGDMAHFMDTVLRHKILFGTDWPMLDYDRALGELAELGLRDETVAAYTEKNAARLLERLL